ncbi:hypothetical protein IB277_34805 [Ensifer sp. ENS07]|uniref:hypothetical protein n=1 Tax=Ensifer sp. ENS07 TaxID=2769274 RepID=UPI00177FA8BE|nr:hypothetical protein [Ensifer sp. ENS07]MBD9641466.1 hypothetical protein [Ensifer sp. ENS07]
MLTKFHFVRHEALMGKHSGTGERPATKGPLLAKAVRNAKVGKFTPSSKARIDAVMKAAEHSGLLGEKSKLFK